MRTFPRAAAPVAACCLALSIACAGGASSPVDVVDAIDAVDAADLPSAAVYRVMTFNLRTPFGDTDENAWEFRRDRATGVLAAQAPDLMGTQEGWLFQLEDLMTAVPGYAWAGTSRSDSDVDEYSAVFWRTDRFDAEASGTFWLGTDPSDPLSTFGPAQAFPRIATWVRLRPRDGSGPFLFLNTHVDYETADDIQQKSAALLVRKAAELGAGIPVVVTGDFNAPPAGAPWNILTGAAAWEDTRGDFTDAWVELDRPEEGTFHGFTGTSSTGRIDWILHRGGFAARNVRRVTDAAPDGRYPSDHFPVWADLERVP